MPADQDRARAALLDIGQRALHASQLLDGLAALVGTASLSDEMLREGLAVANMAVSGVAPAMEELRALLEAHTAGGGAATRGRTLNS